MNLSLLILCSLFEYIKIFFRGGGSAKNDSWHPALIMLFMGPIRSTTLATDHK